MGKIEKVLYTIAEILALTFLLSILALALMGKTTPASPAANTIITRQGVIAEVKGNETFIDTEDGNRWCILDDGYKVGEEVIVAFEGYGTEDVEDDEVIDVRVVE